MQGFKLPEVKIDDIVSKHMDELQALHPEQHALISSIFSNDDVRFNTALAAIQSRNNFLSILNNNNNAEKYNLISLNPQLPIKKSDALLNQFLLETKINEEKYSFHAVNLISIALLSNKPEYNI